MKKLYKFLLLLLSLLSIFGLWYIKEFSMEVASELEINSPLTASKLLIATQSSEYKDLITTAILEELSTQDMYIKVVDVSSLSVIDELEWDCIFIAHTWEFGSPPRAVESFLHQTKAKEKILTLATSTQGTSSIKGVNAVTGASKLENTQQQARLLLKKIKLILSQKEYSTN